MTNEFWCCFFFQVIVMSLLIDEYLMCLVSILSFFLFWPYHVACEILVPQPGIELAPPAVEV